MQKIYGKSVNREAIFTLWTAIETKAKEHGLRTVRVSEMSTTKTCSSCGQETGPNGAKNLHVREWTCSNCGAEHKRDVNAAINIMKNGIELDRLETIKLQKKKKEEELKSIVPKEYVINTGSFDGLRVFLKKGKLSDDGFFEIYSGEIKKDKEVFGKFEGKIELNSGNIEATIISYS